MTRKLPPSASIAEPVEGGKLHAPSAARNAQAICDFLRQGTPKNGTALEIASGTGQHIVQIARALPGLTWQPTDIQEARLRSIDAHVREAELGNVAPSLHLDATLSTWVETLGPYDVILIVNLLHLISDQEVIAILTQTAKALTASGTLFIYGPFRRDGALTSSADQEFDTQLRAADPLIGYKDTRDMERWVREAGLLPDPPVEMPANNLFFTCRKGRS